MGQNFHDIRNIFNIPQWEILQELLAAASNTAIITIDYKGIPATVHSRCCPFCQSVRANPWLYKLCQTCDSRGGLEAVRAQQPYIYLCHFNIVDFAVPIIVDDKYIGAVMAGQVKLALSSEYESLERILSYSKNYVAIQHFKEHYDEYMAIPKMSLESVEKFAQLLFQLCKYIVDNIDRQNHSSKPDHYSVSQGTETPSYHNFYNLKRRKKSSGESDILKPALDLLSSIQGTEYSQKEMADLCHISPSYFSRLFIKETGQNYSQYVTRIKIEKAKQMLEHGNYAIAFISNELGFSSPGYFTKIFKKIEGITPHLYRKYYQDADNIIGDSTLPLQSDQTESTD